MTQDRLSKLRESAAKPAQARLRQRRQNLEPFLLLTGRCWRAGTDAIKEFGDAPRAEPTRDALAARLVGAEREDVPHQLSDGRVFIEGYHAAVPDTRTDRPQFLKAERRVE